MGKYPSHRRRFGTRSHRIDAPGVSSFSVRSTTTAFRVHHQRTHRCRRSRPPQRVSRCALSDRPRISSSLSAPPAYGLGQTALGGQRLRVKEPKRSIVPLSIDEVARFWSSFRTTRDLAIVGLMLLQGLRSAEVLGSESGRRAAFRRAVTGSRQRKQAAISPARAGNRSTAGSLHPAGTTQSL